MAELSRLRLRSYKNRLTLFLSNIRSIMPKIDSLESTLRLNNINFAFITETWLNQKIDDGAVQIEGYSLVRQDRVNQKGGGVCAFVNSHAPF